MVCKDCGADFHFGQIVMLYDDLWETIADDPLDCLCDVCIEVRMGRPIQYADFKRSNRGEQYEIPVNEMYMLANPFKFGYKVCPTCNGSGLEVVNNEIIDCRTCGGNRVVEAGVLWEQY